MIIQPSILIIDDERDIREILTEILEDEGYQAFTAADANHGDEVYQSHQPDLVLLDIWMPGKDGIELLKQWQGAGGPSCPVIMITGHGNIETAVEAVKLGAYDFLEKPLSTAKLLLTIDRALEKGRLQRENRTLRKRLEPSVDLLGKSPTIEHLREQIQRVAPTESRVLISGEPGSGKGLIARQIHRASARANANLIEISLASVSADHLAEQLFGTENGAVIHPGYFEQAAGGTLLLDEIVDMEADIQTRLVATLTDKHFRRIGGQQDIELDVRILATTNQDIVAAIADKRFREDLYYRLNVIPIEMPPLRNYVEDIPELVRFFIHDMVAHENLPRRDLGKGALKELMRYDWPGNVLELKNLLQRLLILSHGSSIETIDVRRVLDKSNDGDNSTIETDKYFNKHLREARDEFERRYLQYHLSQHGGNVTQLARSSSMERTHLYRKMKLLGIDPKAIKTSLKTQ